MPFFFLHQYEASFSRPREINYHLEINLGHFIRGKENLYCQCKCSNSVENSQHYLSAAYIMREEKLSVFRIFQPSY